MTFAIVLVIVGLFISAVVDTVRHKAATGKYVFLGGDETTFIGDLFSQLMVRGLIGGAWLAVLLQLLSREHAVWGLAAIYFAWAIREAFLPPTFYYVKK